MLTHPLLPAAGAIKWFRCRNMLIQLFEKKLWI